MLQGEINQLDSLLQYVNSHSVRQVIATMLRINIESLQRRLPKYRRQRQGQVCLPN